MNTLHDYIRDRGAAEALAAACSTKVIYLRHVALGHRRASPQLARLIEVHSSGRVTARELRPDIFGDMPAADSEPRAA